jgi:KDO2-lipid IV(A) lauroyltransferase
MRPVPQALQHHVVYLAGRFFLLTLALVPLAVGRAGGRLLGRLFYLLSPRHRRIALANLQRSFGATMPPEQRRRIARSCFSHMGMLCADATFFPRLARMPTERIACYEGEEHLQAAAALGRGVLVFSGPFGHWELVALLQPRLGVPLAMVVRQLNNLRFDRVLGRLRGLTGNVLLPKGNAVRGVLRTLRNGGAVAILIDQNVRGKGGLFVDFFGVPASTSPSLATFAFKCNTPIVPVFSYPMPDGRLRIRYQKAILPVRRGALADDIMALTGTCTSILEAEIRRHPGLWLWMHDRWRTRPQPAAPGPARSPARAPGVHTAPGAATENEARST